MEWQHQFCWHSGSLGNIIYIYVIMLAASALTAATYVDLMERNLPVVSGEPYFRSQEYHQPSGRNLQAVSAASYLLAQGPGRGKNAPSEPTGPYFVNPGIKRNVTTTVGQTAYLHCHVAQLGDEAKVSWIRKRDLHVLSSGVVVFASDQRFQVLHPAESDKWTLQIKYAQSRDAGIYECQVNTEPKISRSYLLSVVESRARILGPEYVKAGSTINLTCVINQPHMQSLVYWYHNREILDYESVSINTRGDGERTTSHLTITEATTQHSGNYTCWPTSAQPTSAIVNVVEEGEQPAAMQTGVGCHLSLGVGALLLQGALQILLRVALHILTDPVIRR